MQALQPFCRRPQGCSVTSDPVSRLPVKGVVMPKRSIPCSACGDPRPVSTSSGDVIVCHPCRRARRGVAPTVCAHCSATFTSNWQRGKWSRTCSKACAAAQVHTDGRGRWPARQGQRHDAEALRLLRRIKTQRRRARIRDAYLEDVDVRVLLERDRGKCTLCSTTVTTDVVRLPSGGLAPHTATIDHIVPLSRGGEHSYANTRLACLGCNVRRGNRGGLEQLALLG